MSVKHIFNLKKLKKQQTYQFFYMTLLVLSLFLMVTASLKICWIITSVVLTIILVPTYWYLLWALMIFVLIYMINIGFYSPVLDGLIDGEFQVVKVLSQGPVIDVGTAKVLIKSLTSFNVGDLILVKGMVAKVQNWNEWDFVTFLYSHNIGHIVLNGLVEKIYTHDSLYIEFKNYLRVYPLLSWMILGLKTFDGKAIYDLINVLNLAHLFVISGFHISGFFLIFKKLFRKISCDELWLLLPLGLLWWYVYWCNWAISALRGAFWVTFQWVNDIFLKQRLNNHHLLCSVLLVMLIIWPYQIYSFSFILSFLATFTIISMLKLRYFNDQEYVKTSKRRMFKYFLLSVTIYFMTLPITIYLNQAVNLSGLLISLILSPLVIVYQLSSCLLLPFPFWISLLHESFVLISYGVNYVSLIVEVTWFNPFNLILIYTFTFNTLIIIKQLNYLKNIFLFY